VPTVREHPAASTKWQSCTATGDQSGGLSHKPVDLGPFPARGSGRFSLIRMQCSHHSDMRHHRVAERYPPRITDCRRCIDSCFCLCESCARLLPAFRWRGRLVRAERCFREGGRRSLRRQVISTRCGHRHSRTLSKKKAIRSTSVTDPAPASAVPNDDLCVTGQRSVQRDD
jgi:hypothetical protein